MQRPAGLHTPSSPRLLLLRPSRPLRARARGMHMPAALSILPPCLCRSVDDDDGTCGVFMDRDGEAIRVMCCDYGFRAGAGRLYQENYGEVPGNVFEMVGGAGGKGQQVGCTCWESMHVVCAGKAAAGPL